MCAERVHGELVQRLCSREPAEHGEDGTVRREPEVRASLRSVGAEMRSRNRAPDHAVLATVTPRDRVGEEDATREGSREPVREPQVSVRLGQRGGDAAQARGQHHRAGDVAATAEDDVGPPPREDPAARERRLHRLCKRSEQPDTESAREARDREGVELEARLRNELRLDAVGRPGERHRHPACAQRFGDCERGTNVPGGPSRRDQTPKLGRPFHSRRC